MLLLHAGTVLALFYFSWSALLVGLVSYWVAGGLGIGIGYHRLLTHRGLRVPKPLEYALALCGSLALQGGPIWWVATHRVHHAFTDREGDPHSPRDGAWWSLMGWILREYSGRNDPALAARYAPDLTSDPFHVWLTRLHLLPPVAVAVLFYVFGGLPYLLWGTFVSITLMLHATWLVNSAAHMWGSRRYETRDDSRNSWWVALVTFGEGWHNNHHARPAAARHGLTWYEIDVNWWCIRLLHRLRLASAVRLATIGSSIDVKPVHEAATRPAV
jgi:stearoyl-CoA desaturase (delta-9 desaturase)